MKILNQFLSTPEVSSINIQSGTLIYGSELLEYNFYNNGENSLVKLDGSNKYIPKYVTSDSIRKNPFLIDLIKSDDVTDASAATYDLVNLPLASVPIGAAESKICSMLCPLVLLNSVNNVNYSSSTNIISVA